MRRSLALTVALVALALALVARAGADDTHTYEIELDNAFGLVEGSQVRVSGVNVGVVTALAVTPQKRALVTIEVSGPLARLGDRTRCTTEPQSLIAEYFIDCSPRGKPLADGATIPVEQTSQTVQLDLVQATFDQPTRQRLRLLVNEFGTGLAARGEDLNAAIRRGAPALGELNRVLATLASRNRVLRGLVTDADHVLGELSARRAEVVRFIREARGVAATAASQRDALSADVAELDDALARLRPALVELGSFSRVQAPLLANLERAAGELTGFGREFPAFAAASERALVAAGRTSVDGRTAVRHATPAVRELARGGRQLPATAELLKDFLRDLDDPRRVVEIDQRAARTCDQRTLSCWATGRPAPTGYTGFEGLLNYAYYLAGATNQVDQVSHLLHVSLWSVGTAGNPCGDYSTGGQPGTEEHGVPAADGGLTTDIREAASCVSWLGPNQPGINEDLGLDPYPSAVCPDGSAAPLLCAPAATQSSPAGEAAGAQAGAYEPGTSGGASAYSRGTR